jgi:uncharacterized membrane protein YkvA (DUF1232 family)
MNVKAVALELTEGDILSIIRDYVSVEGLCIEGIELGDKIKICGYYKKVLKLPFKVSLVFTEVRDNKLLLRIDSISLGRVGVFKWAKEAALKMLSKSLQDIGIRFVDGQLVVSLNHILAMIPFKLSFNLKELKVLNKLLNIHIEDICFSMIKETVEARALAVIVKEDIEIKNDTGTPPAVEKVQDGYTKLRDTVERKVPDSQQHLVEYILILPDIVALFYRLFKDKRVPVKTKILVGGILAYLVSPIDILPDFIPFVGKIDDLALAFFALEKIINEVPENVILDNWQGRTDIIIKVREGIDYITRAAGGTNVGKLVKFISNISHMKGNKNYTIYFHGKEENI